jgi:hypothetical protein
MGLQLYAHLQEGRQPLVDCPGLHIQNLRTPSISGIRLLLEQTEDKPCRVHMGSASYEHMYIVKLIIIVIIIIIIIIIIITYS